MSSLEQSVAIPLSFVVCSCRILFLRLLTKLMALMAILHHTSIMIFLDILGLQNFDPCPLAGHDMAEGADQLEDSEISLCNTEVADASAQVRSVWCADVPGFDGAFQIVNFKVKHRQTT